MNDCETLEPSAIIAAPAEENPSAWRADTLTDGVLIVLALMLVQRSVGFLRAILFCRWLDAEQLGLWDMAFGFLMLAAPLVVLSLPGTFGRYAERYRRRGRLRTFLLQTSAVCLGLALGGAGGIVWFRKTISALVFGAPNHESLVILLAGCLLVIVAYNYALSLFTALRAVRLSSAMEFFNGISFAVLGIALPAVWRCDAAAVILAWGGANLVCVLGAGLWCRKALAANSFPDEQAENAGIWRSLIPFAAWVMLLNAITNLYGYTDRYLILHFAPGGEGERLALVGQYHSARLVPLLLASLATMISMILLPHLSYDWESGRRERVSFRTNLFLKLAMLGTFAAATAVLAAAPLLFDLAFRGKFAGGSAAMPGMLAAAVWFGAAAIAIQYIWCAERAGLAVLATGVGLAVNAAINLLLLPVLGLTSAVLAAMAANLVMLLSILQFARMLGLGVQRGAWILLAAPASLCLGPWAAVGALAAVSFLALRTDLIFNRDDKAKIAEKWGGYCGKLAGCLSTLPRFGAGARKNSG
ncbi:MAG: lipopolysaccharide biosynthesis protein [Pirellulales bacterium]|nr:lipopolysaccharide biosynthesis protein [Pirellulales bacterium]